MAARGARGDGDGHAGRRGVSPPHAEEVWEVTSIAKSSRALIKPEGGGLSGELLGVASLDFPIPLRN